MTPYERKIAVLLASIAQGNLTVNQLKRIVADGQARVERLGAGNVEQKTLDAIRAGEEALERIARERVKYDRQTNN
jgi:ParB-like chromosome segregation protein Spo0J